MSKMLQIIGKKTNHKNGTVDVELLQTDFESYTKTMTSVPGQTLDNATAGANVGYQFFHDLIARQLAVIPSFDNYKAQYTAAINSKKGKVTFLNNFIYNFGSLTDYRASFYDGQKADYKAFSRLIAAEKEMYDFTVFAKSHIQENCRLMGEWSKAKYYGSNFSMCHSKEVETNGTHDWGWSLHTAPRFMSVKIINSARDKKWFEFHNCFNIPAGYTDYCIWSIGGGTHLKLSITKHSLGVIPDDGYFTKNSRGDIIQYEVIKNSGAIRRYNFSEGVGGLRNIISPHFTDPSGQYKLNFFKNRVLI